MTPEQQRKNRRTGFIFLAVVVVLFAWYIVKQVYA